jgi:hypothetical protein
MLIIKNNQKKKKWEKMQNIIFGGYLGFLGYTNTLKTLKSYISNIFCQNFMNFHPFVEFLLNYEQLNMRFAPQCAVAVVRRNLCHTYSLPLKARKLKFWLPESFEPT